MFTHPKNVKKIPFGKSFSYLMTPKNEPMTPMGSQPKSLF